MQPVGLILALVTFLSIWLGHVLVRSLHKRYGTRPGIPFIVLGVAVLVLSSVVGNLLSAVLGIIAITFCWDGIEFYRQEKRVQREKESIKS